MSEEVLRSLSILFGISSSALKILGGAFTARKLKEYGFKKKVGSYKDVNLPNERLRGDTDPFQQGAENQPQRKSVIGNSSWVGEIAWFPEKGNNRGAIWMSPAATGKKYIFPNRTFGEYEVLADNKLSPSPKPKHPQKSLHGGGSGVGTQLWKLGYLAGSTRRTQKTQIASLANLFRSARNKDEIKALTLMQLRLGKMKF